MGQTAASSAIYSKTRHHSPQYTSVADNALLSGGVGMILLDKGRRMLSKERHNYHDEILDY